MGNRIVERNENEQYDRVLAEQLGITCDDLGEFERTIEANESKVDNKNKEGSLELKNVFITALRTIVYDLKKGGTSLRISRSQSTVYDDAFIAKIIMEIKRIIIYPDTYGQTIPNRLLYFTNDPSDGFNHQKLIGFLNGYINKLEESRNVNLYFDDFIIELNKLIK